MDPLAGVTELQARMETDVADVARAAAALVDASAAVRAYTGQQFSRSVTSDVLRASPRGLIRLPQRPVNAIGDAVNSVGSDLTWQWDGKDRLWVDISLWANLYPYVRRPELAAMVEVTYDHGYDIIPDDVVAVVCAMAARVLGTPPEKAGIQQTSISNYSESLGTVGASGASGLFDAEMRILDRYRRRVGLAWVS